MHCFGLVPPSQRCYELAQLETDACARPRGCSQDYKTECYKKIVETASPRPGVLELMDSAIAMPGLAVGICSASTRAGFEKVVDSVVGQVRDI